MRISNTHAVFKGQKQPPRGVPRKGCSEIMQKIYRKNTHAEVHFGMGVLLKNLLHIFRTPFLKTLGGCF